MKKRIETKANSRWREKYEKFPSYSFFDDFRKKYKEYKNIDNQRLINIIKSFNNMFMDEMINNKDGVELPYGIGHIFMVSFNRKPSSKRKVNYEVLNKYNKVVGYSNLDTDNRILKIVYTNQYERMPFLRHSAWAFKASDLVRERASKAFRKDYERYYNMNSSQEIKKLFYR